ncbi:DMT family transporter [Paenibacillus yanchengensis]|uniref:DMT family transporter n=1 Tax=Paenibacillus yanchengensis TaxID=2035833 RepID=A0ABW4YHV3_9BACL
MMNKMWVNYVGLIAIAIIWGVNFGVSRLAMESFHPIVFTMLRFGLAIPFFFIILKWKEGNISIPWRLVPYIAVISLLGVTALEIMSMYAIKYTTLANASLLSVAPWPIFAALLSPLFMKEAITPRLILGGAICFIGVSFVILGGDEGFNMSSNLMLGNALALLISIVGPLFNLSSMSLMRQFSALRISTWTIVFGAIFMLPLTIGKWQATNWAALQFEQYAAIVYNVILCTVVAFVVWNACMFRVGATRANFFRYAVPAAAMITGFIMFGESITLFQVLGALVMAAGLVWITRGDRKANLQ